MNIGNDNTTILVVDDQDDARVFARTCLERFGYTVLMACGVREALDIWAVHHRNVSLVLSDGEMIDGTGMELIARFRRIDPDVRAIIFTGAYAPEDEEKISRVLGVRVLAKPVRPNKLIRAIELALAMDTAS